MFAQATIAINAAGDGIASSADRRKRGGGGAPRATPAGAARARGLRGDAATDASRVRRGPGARGAPPPPRANHFPNRDSVW